MFDNPYYNYPIDKVVEALGGKKGGKDMYISPLRDETTASLHIDRKKNLWFDHGIGQGGTNVQLIMLAKRCSQKEAYRFIATLDPTLTSCNISENAKTKVNEVKLVRGIQSDYLVNYLSSRNIPIDLAKKYCMEVIVRNVQRKQDYTLIGFRNNADGYALKSPGGFKSTTKAGITTININGRQTDIPSSDTVSVFEGFFDFLSWMVLQSSECPNCDAVVLNSVAMLNRAADYIRLHDKVILFLDNDDAGMKAMAKIKSICPDKEIIDMSHLYKEYKDLNEMLQNSRGFHTQIKP